jgi:hypothetical protein
MNNELIFIKWCLEICNEQKYKNTSELIKEYNIKVLGC